MGRGSFLARLAGQIASRTDADLMLNRAYLDWNATAPLRAGARTAMLVALEGVGNPSSVHADGRAARAIVEVARGAVAALVRAEPRNVVFTSGGTEANTLALTPALMRGDDARPRDRLIVSAIEHPSVLAGGRFRPEDVRKVRVTEAGTIDLLDLGRQLSGSERPLVSVMAANNETGVVQPLQEVAALVGAAGGILHVDAVQAAGRLPLDIRALGADLMTVSSHKIGGPQGAGALILCEEALHIGEPLLKGGGQERGLRAGTENVAAIAGFGAATAEATQELAAEGGHMLGLRERLEEGLVSIAPDTVIFGASAVRLPNTTLFAVPGFKAETALVALDLGGVSVSSGSACSSGKVAPSHVLAAMGITLDLARGAIRVSTGPATILNDIELFLEAWRKCVETLLKSRRELAA